MFINPKVAIEKGWIKGIKDAAKQVQPNAIDFTLDKVMLLGQEAAMISENRKVMRSTQPVVQTQRFIDSTSPEEWLLDGLRVYDGYSDMYVEVPEGVAAILYTRSTFARNGVFIMSGLYDSGFKGHIGFTIYTPGGFIAIAKGTRIGQIAFIHSENAGMYAGGYSHDQANPAHTPNAAEGPGSSSLRGAGGQFLTEGGDKGEFAKELEKTHNFDSMQAGKPAGEKTFI